MERKKMNKTVKIISIVLIVLGALALTAGIAVGVLGRHLITTGVGVINKGNLPQVRPGTRSMQNGETLPQGFLGRRSWGFLGSLMILPFLFGGGGVLLIVVGVVLLIVNRKKTGDEESVSEPVKEKPDKKKKKNKK
jgi:hypothetical protein